MSRAALRSKWKPIQWPQSASVALYLGHTNQQRGDAKWHHYSSNCRPSLWLPAHIRYAFLFFPTKILFIQNDKLQKWRIKGGEPRGRGGWRGWVGTSEGSDPRLWRLCAIIRADHWIKHHILWSAAIWCWRWGLWVRSSDLQRGFMNSSTVFAGNTTVDWWQSGKRSRASLPKCDHCLWFWMGEVTEMLMHGAIKGWKGQNGNAVQPEQARQLCVLGGGVGVDPTNYTAEFWVICWEFVLQITGQTDIFRKEVRLFRGRVPRGYKTKKQRKKKVTDASRGETQYGGMMALFLTAGCEASKATGDDGPRFSTPAKSLMYRGLN